MYKFDPVDEPVEAGFRKIALSQLDEALGDLDKPEGNGRSVVHEARRRCKKLRGLLRLVRPVFPEFASENAAVRDAAALLSHLRDSEVLHQTVADLAKWRKDAALERIEQRLADRHDPARADRLEEFRARLAEVRKRAEGWSLVKTGCDALMPGLRVTYRSGRRRMERAARSGAALDFHEWRKANKNHGFHIDLLKRLAPELLADDLKTVDALSTQLGLHHDLFVLSEALDERPDHFGEPEDLKVLRVATAARKAEIEAEAFALGRQVFAERPRAVARRFASYWKSAE